MYPFPLFGASFCTNDRCRHHLQKEDFSGGSRQRFEWIWKLDIEQRGRVKVQRRC